MKILRWRCGLGTACGFLLAVAPAGAQEPIHVYVQPDEFLGSIATELSSRSRTGYRFEVTSVDSDSEVVRRVGNDPRAVGVVQHDDYLRDMRGPGSGSARFEFYGDVPACLVIVAATRSSIRSYAQLVAASPLPTATVDVGPEVGRVARMIAALWSTAPTQGNLRLEHRGGARALSRVVAGDIDAAVMLLQPPFADGFLDQLIASGQVELVPFDAPTLVAETLEPNLPYRWRDIPLGGKGWFSSRRNYRTVCTSVGVVVNAAADIGLSEAVARSMLASQFAAPRRSWLAAAGALVTESLAMVGNAFEWTREAIVAALGIGAPGDTAVAGAGSLAPPVIAASHPSQDRVGGEPRTGRPGGER